VEEEEETVNEIMLVAGDGGDEVDDCEMKSRSTVMNEVKLRSVEVRLWWRDLIEIVEAKSRSINARLSWRACEPKSSWDLKSIRLEGESRGEGWC